MVHLLPYIYLYGYETRIPQIHFWRLGTRAWLRMIIIYIYKDKEPRPARPAVTLPPLPQPSPSPPYVPCPLNVLPAISPYHPPLDTLELTTVTTQLNKIQFIYLNNMWRYNRIYWDNLWKTIYSPHICFQKKWLNGDMKISRVFFDDHFKFQDRNVSKIEKMFPISLLDSSPCPNPSETFSRVRTTTHQSFITIRIMAFGRHSDRQDIDFIDNIIVIFMCCKPLSYSCLSS